MSVRMKTSRSNQGPVDLVLEALRAHDSDLKETTGGWSARCPAHDDHRASLSLGEGKDGRALITCHAGCKLDTICNSLGLNVLDLMPTAERIPRRNAKQGTTKTKPVDSKPDAKQATNGTNGSRKIVATYDYRDERGNVLFQVVRLDPKDFRQRQPKPGGDWNWSVKGVRVVPFGLPVIAAYPTRKIVVCEGEKDVLSLGKIDVLATCNSGGAGKWTTEHSEFLRGRDVVILPDNDEAGRNHAINVAQLLRGIAASIKIIQLLGLPPKGDVSDWLSLGGTKDKLQQLEEATAEWDPNRPLAWFQQDDDSTFAGNDGPNEWPELDRFDSVSLPEFPCDVLPPVLRDWVQSESIATQTPPDLAGLLALSVCSSCLARRVEVQPRPGWCEPVNLYTAILLEPGNRKSAVFTDALRPLRDVENELVEAARPRVAREQSDRRQDEARLRKLEKIASEKLGDEGAQARHEAGNLAEELASKPEPSLPRLLIDDSTSEKIGMLLEAQGGRIASMSPEGGVFDLMAGLYSKSGIPQFGVYLMGHSGDDLVTDRVSRPTVRVVRPALTCSYTMQPSVIAGLAKQTAFRGRGLLARFLYASPRSWIGRRRIAPPAVPYEVREAYHQLVRRLSETEGEFTLGLTEGAYDVFLGWETEIESMLADGGALEVMRDWGAKLAGATLRLAGVLHCVEHGPTGSIPAAIIEAAIEIARYLVPHAEATLRMMAANDENSDDDARYVLAWIERHGRREFTKSEAQQHGKRRFPKADDIDPALMALCGRSYIRLRPTEFTGPGRPPSPTYEVNPVIFEEQKPEKRSEYSKNVPENQDGESFQNTQSAVQQIPELERVQVVI